MNHYLRAVVSSVMAALLGLLLTGCYLTSVIGHVVVVENLEEEIEALFAALTTNATVAICIGSPYSGQGCTYIIDGDRVTSTFILAAKNPIEALLVDPLIAQLPADVTTITATYDIGGGPQPLLVTPVQSFRATPFITVTAEAGQRFVILELPPAVEALVPEGDPTTGLPISYTLAYERLLPIAPPPGPQTIKLMLAGRVEIYGQKYYVPLLPCVSDFALVPAFTLPEAATPQNLAPTLGDALEADPAAACDQHVYHFGYILPPPQHKLYLPALWR